MSELRIRNLPEEDYEWLKSLAALDNVKLEAWMRRFIREARLGISPTLFSPAAVTLVPTGPLIPIHQPSYQPDPTALTIVESIPEDGYQPTFEDALREADREGSSKDQVVALQRMYDELFPPGGVYKFSRLSERRAQGWLRICEKSAMNVYEYLIDTAWSRRDDDGGYLDHTGKPLDNPATYADGVLKRYKPAEESTPATYGHSAPLKEFDPFPLEERGVCYESSSTAARKQGAISDEDWATIQHWSEKAGYPVGEAS